MDADLIHEENTVLEAWGRKLRDAAGLLRLPFDPVLVRSWIEGADFVACIRKLGGDVLPTSEFNGWVLRAPDDATTEVLKGILPDFYSGDAGVGDFSGLAEVRLDGERFLALRNEERVNQYAVRPSLVLGGPSLAATLRLVARVKTVYAEIFRAKRVRVYGSGLQVPEGQPLDESDLILPAEFKRTLLDYLDTFWRAAGICATLRLAPSRGVLFVGGPGTGKTHTIRHLVGRYPQCSFSIFTAAAPAHGSLDEIFEHMLGQMALDGRPAVVVMEDVDRLFDLGGLSRQLFLNALDGLFQSGQPTLWVATSNDPSEPAPNILDRPGRFDRIFVFELPGVEERLTLVERFSPWPADPSVLRRVAEEADGLSGAHIKEICVSAALAAAEEPARYGDALLVEARRMREQHQQAQRYDFGLGTSQPAGFGRGIRVARVGESGRPAAGRGA